MRASASSITTCTIIRVCLGWMGAFAHAALLNHFFLHAVVPNMPVEDLLSVSSMKVKLCANQFSFEEGEQSIHKHTETYTLITWEATSS